MKEYTVQPGDTLESIAEDLYGDSSMAQYIASINSIKAVPGFAGGWFYVVSPGDKLIVDVPEVEGKKIKWWHYAIGATILGYVGYRIYKAQ